MQWPGVLGPLRRGGFGGLVLLLGARGNLGV